MTLAELLDVELRVVNIGVRDFAESLQAQGVQVVEIDWTPPAALEPELAELLEKLL